MKIITIEMNPWNDEVQHFAVSLNRDYNDDSFFVIEKTEGHLFFLFKDKISLGDFVTKLQRLQITIKQIINEKANEDNQTIAKGGRYGA